MSTTTTNLGLVKPDPQELYDIAVHNGNSDKIDVAYGVTFCTSSTRPSTPVVKQHIFETDTTRGYGWNGTSWVQLYTLEPPTIPEPPDTIVSNVQTVLSYTLVLSDKSKAVEMNNAAANTVNIPTNASVAFPVGTVIEVFQAGAGQTTVAALSGVTLRAPDGAKLAKQYASASLRKRATDEWVLAGNTIT